MVFNGFQKQCIRLHGLAESMPSDPCTAIARERVECEEREACGFRKASSEFACDFLASSRSKGASQSSLLSYHIIPS
jgi:hypothetical protein